MPEISLVKTKGFCFCSSGSPGFVVDSGQKAGTCSTEFMSHITYFYVDPTIVVKLPEGKRMESLRKFIFFVTQC